MTFLPLQVLHPVLDFLCDTLFPVLLFLCFFGSKVPHGVDVVEYPESSGMARLSSSAMFTCWMVIEKARQSMTERSGMDFLHANTRFKKVRLSVWLLRLDRFNVTGWHNLVTDLMSRHLLNHAFMREGLVWPVVNRVAKIVGMKRKGPTAISLTEKRRQLG